ncbi:thioester reductase domain-containing protein [Streptomyces sp. NPDC001514]
MRISSRPTAALVTGATGFLGSYLCRELLKEPAAMVYCLVRASSSAEARSRLNSRLREIGTSDDDLQRVMAIPGDLSRPGLGISEAHYGLLARYVEVIHHCGASTNMAASYSRIKATNVTSTIDVLRLATHGRVIPVHFVSTLGVLMAAYSHGGIPEVQEEHDVPLEHVPKIGYEHSKWVSERLIREAHLRGVPTAIHRPGLILGDSAAGDCSPIDGVALILQACLQIGAVPDTGKLVPVSSVDYVSRSIAAIAAQPHLLGQTYNLIDPRPMSWAEVFSQLRAYGYDLETVPYSAWWARLQAERGRPPARSLAAMSLFMAYILSDDPRHRLPRFTCDRTTDLLAGPDSAVTLPLMDGPYFHRMFERLREMGALSPERVRSGVPSGRRGV